MSWRGKPEYTANVLQLVQMGEHWVPRKVSLHFRGEDGMPDLRATFEVRKGAPECVEVRIVAPPASRGIRNVDLSALNPDGMATRAFLHFARERNFAGVEDEISHRAARKSLETNRAGRPKVPREELAEVARIYLSYEGAGNPTASVAKVLGLTSRTAARRVQRAREEGLLPPRGGN